MVELDDVNQILEGLEALAANPPTDPKLQRRLYDAAQKLALAVEPSYDTIYRVIYSPIILPVAEIASNLEIFQTLVERHGSPSTVAVLAAVRGADVALVGRIARHLASHGMIVEVGEDAYVGNHITKTLSAPGFRAGIKHYLHATMACLEAAPEFLEETKYANPSDMLNSPFQKAFKTDLPRFAWMRSRPGLLANFGVWMTAQHDSQMTWLDVLDFRELSKGMTAERTVFVDIGGGIGHQCAMLKSKIPNLTGKIVLQDSESVIKRSLPTPGVDKMPFDFWEEQFIYGARAYYMRYIMHDYPDEKCRRILRNTMAAMGPDSIILIDDVIIPNKGAHPYATDKDIAMMVNFAAMERTQSQWESLFTSVGLRILNSATYNDASGESIQMVAKDDQHELS